MCWTNAISQTLVVNNLVALTPKGPRHFILNFPQTLLSLYSMCYIQISNFLPVNSSKAHQSKPTTLMMNMIVQMKNL